MKRTPISPRRREPRQRVAPQADRAGWDVLDAALQARAGGRCEVCGEPLNGRVERHHRKRRRDGGDTLSNLLALRPGCHQYWTEHPAAARERGIIVSVYADPAATPALLRGSWVLLTDDGRVVPTDSQQPRLP